MRPKGTRHWTNTTSLDQSAVALSTYDGITEGCIYSIDLSWTGQGVNDRIILKDAVAGNVLWEFVIPTAAGSYAAHLPAVGIAFETGIYFNPNIGDTTAGKLKINIGWDVRN